MADTKISALTSATLPLSGSELVPIVQSGTTVKTAISNIASNQPPTPYTANGVVYASSTSALATGSGLVFNGTNLGLGVTPSAWDTFTGSFQIAGASLSGLGANNTALASNAYYQSAWKYYGTAGASLYQQNAGQHVWSVAGSGTATNAISFNQAMTLDASGNLLVGETSAGYSSSGRGVIEINGSSSSLLAFRIGSTNKSYIFQDGTNFNFASSITGGALTFLTQDTERMRIDSSGNLLVGTTSASGNGERINVTGSSTSFIAAFLNTSTGARRGFYCTYTGSSPPNDSGNEFLYCNDNSALRMTVRSNGGIANYSANNVNLSDETMKKDIQLAGNYLDKLTQIPVKTFLFNDQTDTDLNLGVIAQDVKAVAPELVGTMNIGTDEKPNVKLAIYETDLKYAMLKAIQELNTLVTTQSAEIAALKQKVGI